MSCRLFLCKYESSLHQCYIANCTWSPTPVFGVHSSPESRRRSQWCSCQDPPGATVWDPVHYSAQFWDPIGSCNFVSLWKNLLALINFKLHSKLCDYLYCAPLSSITIMYLCHLLPIARDVLSNDKFWSVGESTKTWSQKYTKTKIN